MVLIGKSISEDFLIFAYYMKIKLTLEVTLGNDYKEYEHHYREREHFQVLDTSQWWLSGVVTGDTDDDKLVWWLLMFQICCTTMHILHQKTTTSHCFNLARLSQVNVSLTWEVDLMEHIFAKAHSKEGDRNTQPRIQELTYDTLHIHSFIADSSKVSPRYSTGSAHICRLHRNTDSKLHIHYLSMD
jgi:hypothetical protein